MKASAYIVGPQDGAGLIVATIARTLDFEVVRPFEGIAGIEQQTRLTPVCFFLFAAVEDPTVLAAAANAIRFYPSRRVRFSPLVYFADNPSLDDIKTCINMGFDDVITQPFTGQRVMDRLARQIDTPVTYFETAEYFGPDRRGRVGDGSSTSARRGTGGQFRRLEIMRSLAHGLTVVRDEAHLAA